MYPRDARMIPSSTSGVYVAGEVRANARLVEENKRKHAQEEAAEKISPSPAMTNSRRKLSISCAQLAATRVLTSPLCTDFEHTIFFYPREFAALMIKPPTP